MSRVFDSVCWVLVLSALLTLTLTACGGDVAPPPPASDAGETDFGAVDAGLSDGGRDDADVSVDGALDDGGGSNPCAAPMNPCGAGECIAIGGAYVCTCPAGYRLAASPSLTCVDVDECAEGVAACTQIPAATCENTAGSYLCTCPLGYGGDGRGGGGCSDIDECAASTNPCGPNACVNSEGSYGCECSAGYELATLPVTTCVDVDECASAANPCDPGACVNEVGAYSCACAAGYRFVASPAASCIDIDECVEGSDLCTDLPAASCGNTGGSYTCTCPTGYSGLGVGAGGCGTVCTSSSVDAALTRRPADVIWVVDNSASMDQEIQNVQAGINVFADFIAATGVDFRVIMLSRRGVGASGTRYSICVPPPLAGDAACGNGPRFFHSSIDILSTQPLEQILGTLGQTTGYGPTDARGGEPWRGWLRPTASKTFVVVTDDNARFSAANFEHFRGPPPATEWRNPATTSPSLFLPPGILEPEWGGLFDGYQMSAIYGYMCATGDPGATYSDLVAATGGVRADICAPPSSWGPFFASIATEVVRSARISCDLPLPPPPAGVPWSRRVSTLTSRLQAVRPHCGRRPGERRVVHSCRRAGTTTTTWLRRACACAHPRVTSCRNPRGRVCRYVLAARPREHERSNLTVPPIMLERQGTSLCSGPRSLDGIHLAAATAPAEG